MGFSISGFNPFKRNLWTPTMETPCVQPRVVGCGPHPLTWHKPHLNGLSSTFVWTNLRHGEDREIESTNELPWPLELDASRRCTLSLPVICQNIPFDNKLNHEPTIATTIAHWTMTLSLNGEDSEKIISSFFLGPICLLEMDIEVLFAHPRTCYKCHVFSMWHGHPSCFVEGMLILACSSKSTYNW